MFGGVENIAIAILLAGYPPLGLAVFVLWKAYRRLTEETVPEMTAAMSDLTKVIDKWDG